MQELAPPENRPRVDIIGRYRIRSAQNEGRAASLASSVAAGGFSDRFWHAVFGAIFNLAPAEPRKEIPTIYFAPCDRLAHESTADAKRLNFWDGLADNGAPKITAENRNGAVHVGKRAGLCDDFPDDQYRPVH